MGRMATHTGQYVTWDQALNSEVQFVADIDNMTFDSDAPDSQRFAFYGVDDIETGKAVMRELAQQRLIDEVAGIPVMEVTPQVVFGERVGAMPTLATYAPFDWKLAWVKADA